MFTTLPFVVISLFFTLFGFLLAGALSGLLTIYSASKSKNATSIRWSRQSGYVEMFCIVIHSARHVPRSATTAMVVMIIASLVSMFANVGLSRMVARTNIETNPGTLLSQTNQLIPSLYLSVGWTEFLGKPSAAVATLTSMLVNPQYIPNMNSRKRYMPKTYPYEVACNKFGVGITPNMTAMILNPLNNTLYLDAAECSAIVFAIDSLLFHWTLPNATYEEISVKQFKFVVGGSFLSGLVDLTPKLAFLEWNFCSCFQESGQSVEDISISGMTALPSTLISKCQQPTGEVQVATATSFPFSIRHVEQYDNVTSTIFDDRTPLLLLDAMGKSFKNGTLANPNVNSTMVILLDTSGPMIHYMSCSSQWVIKPNDYWIMCRYIVISALTTGPSPGDPTIAEVIGDRPTTIASYTSNSISLRHLISSVTKDGMAVYPVSEILNATSDLTLYMTSLGPNLVMDDINQQLTILYDTADIQSVSEMSTTVVWIMVAVMVVCAGIMLFAMIKYDAKHRGSLYMVLYEKIKPQLDECDPALMNCTFEPMALDGIGVLQIDGENIERRDT